MEYRKAAACPAGWWWFAFAAFATTQPCIRLAAGAAEHLGLYGAVPASQASRAYHNHRAFRSCRAQTDSPCSTDLTGFAA